MSRTRRARAAVAAANAATVIVDADEDEDEAPRGEMVVRDREGVYLREIPMVGVGSGGVGDEDEDEGEFFSSLLVSPFMCVALTMTSDFGGLDFSRGSWHKTLLNTC